MIYSIHIDQVNAVEWGLNFSEAALVDFFSRLPSWADHTIINGELFFFASRNKIITELPMLSKNKKTDTVYRLIRSLEAKGIVFYIKQGKKDLVRLTEKGKTWNSEKNPNKAKESENYPNKLGKLSENNSEKNPTYNNTSINKGTKDNNLTDFEKFWNLYDYKVGRKKCEAKWKRLKADEKTAIFDHVPRYVKSTPDDQYRKHPLTYLNGGHWEDEIKLRKEGAEEKPRAGFVLPANFVAARFKMKAQ